MYTNYTNFMKYMNITTLTKSNITTHRQHFITFIKTIIIKNLNENFNNTPGFLSAINLFL